MQKQRRPGNTQANSLPEDAIEEDGAGITGTFTATRTLGLIVLPGQPQQLDL